MKKTIFTLTLLFFGISTYAQNFQKLGTDPESDRVTSFGLDLKSIEVATDLAQDSIWIQVECFNKFSDDWGLILLFDTNEVANDGKTWSNNATNNSLTYDMKLEVLNNKYFPPTHILLYDTSGQKFTQDVSYKYVDSFKIIIAFELKHIGSDGQFNLLVGGASFDGIPNDNQPDANYYTYHHKAQDTSTVNVPNTLNSSQFRFYPNPANGFITVTNNSDVIAIELIDISGTEYPLILQENKIDLTDFPSGIYFLRTTNENNELSISKLLIQ